MGNNAMIREFARKNKIALWQIALEIGISEATITRWLRVPLSEEREKLIFEAARAIAAEREEARPCCHE